MMRFCEVMKSGSSVSVSLRLESSRTSRALGGCWEVSFASDSSMDSGGFGGVVGCTGFVLDFAGDLWGSSCSDFSGDGDRGLALWRQAG